jgi:hypothetical protein
MKYINGLFAKKKHESSTRLCGLQSGSINKTTDARDFKSDGR